LPVITITHSADTDAASVRRLARSTMDPFHRTADIVEMLRLRARGEVAA
jgi:hypothetical protein